MTFARLRYVFLLREIVALSSSQFKMSASFLREFNSRAYINIAREYLSTHFFRNLKYC